MAFLNLMATYNVNKYVIVSFRNVLCVCFDFVIFSMCSIFVCKYVTKSNAHSCIIVTDMYRRKRT